MVKLSVNINKIATLRNSRGENNPDVLKTALDIISFGAHGITVHPRPDERHIRYSDVIDLKKNIKVELNVEGYPNREYIRLIKEVQPAQATLVPDPPDALTSDAGWEIEKNQDFINSVMAELKPAAARVSLFVDPKTCRLNDLELAKKMGVDRVELYTKSYADSFAAGEKNKFLASYQRLAQEAEATGLDVNAGHDLNLHNLNYLLKAIPQIVEVSIGHALICDALYFGLKDTISRYLEQLRV